MKAAAPNRSGSSSGKVTGADIHLTAERSYRVKVRTKLHSSEILGIIVSTREGGRTSRISQYDIRPNLDQVTRNMIQEMMSSVFAKLSDISSFEKGLTQLEKMVEAGHIVLCTIVPVKS